jgi:flagellin-like protein
MMNRISVNRKRRGLSPLLATVLLLGITIAAGGAVYALYTGSTTTASNTNSIRVDSATAVKGSNHADFAITISNAGNTPWDTLEVWLANGPSSKPILYEALHEIAVSDLSEEVDNPLRLEGIVRGTDGGGFGIGRKFVLSVNEPGSRTVPVAVPGFVAGTDDIQEIDGSFDTTAAVTCTVDDIDVDGDGTGDLDSCTVFTRKEMDSPIAPGESMRFYADLILEKTIDATSISELSTGNLSRIDLIPTFVDVGDEIAVNIRAVGTDGQEAQFQTVVIVHGA